jgi:hypothetical protein
MEKSATGWMVTAVGVRLYNYNYFCQIYWYLGEDTDPGAGDAPAGVTWMWMADDDGPNGIFVDDRTKEKIRRHSF